MIYLLITTLINKILEKMCINNDFFIIYLNKFTMFFELVKLSNY